MIFYYSVTETKINLEIARELNDANTRSAIQWYQSDRKKSRDTFKKEINAVIRIKKAATMNVKFCVRTR